MSFPFRRKKGSKFRNIKTVVDGHAFDSKKEARYYEQNVKPMLAAGKLKDLKIHPVYPLQNGFKRNGFSHRAITYEADFEFINVADGRLWIVDVKASKFFLTDVYKIKKKLFLKALPEDVVFMEIF